MLMEQSIHKVSHDVSFTKFLVLQRFGEGVAVVHRVDVFAQEENVEPVQTESVQNYYWAIGSG